MMPKQPMRRMSAPPCRIDLGAFIFSLRALVASRCLCTPRGKDPGRVAISKVILFALLVPANPALGLTWWGTSAPYANWMSIACSADGTKIVAGIYQGGIYRSENSGATWVQTGAPISNWSSIASSADGARLVAAGSWQCGPGPLYVSTNSGGSWIETSAPIAGWCSVACSAV
jgi:hypothetical protein